MNGYDRANPYKVYRNANILLDIRFLNKQIKCLNLNFKFCNFGLHTPKGRQLV